MARKRKKKSFGTNLKFEIYGIVLIMLSWITIAGKGELPGLGPVGRAISSLCFFLAGKLYFVLPLVLIYIGVYVMVKREWPRSWSYRKTGLLLLMVAYALHLHIGLFQELRPEGGATSREIMSQPFQNLSDKFQPGGSDAAFKQAAGGGFVGAFVYGISSLLFDTLGARFIEIALIAIGFMCLTGWSYVEMGTKLRGALRGIGQDTGRKVREWQAKRTASRLVVGTDRLEEPVEGSIDEETYWPEKERKKERKKPVFFDLFRASDKSSAEAGTRQEELESDIYPSDSEPADYDPAGTSTGVRGESEEWGNTIRFRDFQEEWQEQADIADAGQLDGDPFVTEPSFEPDPFEESADPAAAAADGPLISETRPGTLTVSFPKEEGAASAAGMGSVPAGASAPAPGRGEQAEPSEEMDLALGVGEAEPVQEKPYTLPSFHLLAKPAGGGRAGASLDYQANARKLEQTMESFGVRAKVLEVVRGPSVTRYEIQPDVGVKVSRVVGLTDDIALALAAKDIRMEAPIPGKSAIGIEVPNSEVAIVSMREVMESAAFHESDAKLSIALGRDISGQAIVANLAKMPHLLVAGATGSGKSVCINGIITSVLFKAKPDEVKFLMIDPKMVELNVYNGIPHLLAPVVTDPRRASLALKKVVKEMEQRYEQFSKSGTRNIEGYNALLEQQGEKKLPYIVVIVDELADLMMVAANDVEDAICRLAQMARAAGIHLIIATQRPSVDVITGVIKANIPSRIAFGVSSQVDSRTILDSAGAEKLLGRGDMLFVPVGASKPIRIQGAFLSDKEVEAVVDFVRTQQEAVYREELVPTVEEASAAPQEAEDELYDQAVQVVLEAKQASVSLLQRRMRIGYTRAARLIDAMEAKGVVGPYEGSKPREVLVSLEQYNHSQIPS
ncbi:hypothetical protein XYCOK13_14050 [Xylanibacillus composti]|uniref:FtsK domain-containing protein n=1 Tax=Xylanibacillus composti TaxID=1572762 RepID=A0A8J4H2X4_9BACL|nr:DNA translocase FtsK [Xylanibacillus composti]GIQ68581.1 hypothetical protein XYCOK13_14050 [Xylanibacillus composti]